MSGVVGTGLWNDLVRDITEGQIFSYITVASTALIVYDWFLTSNEELTFVWRQGRNRYVQILFVGARYTALACAPFYWVPALANHADVVLWLDIVIVVCSELIFVLRTWAIWERSRPILVFLIGLLIAFTVLSIVVIELSMAKSTTPLLTSSVTVIFEGWGPVEMPTSSVQYAWVASTPFLLILVLQSVVLAMTSYKVLRYRSKYLTRSTLMDVIWIEGITYFAFMFIVGALNVGLIMNVSRPELQFGLLQFQMVLHSILSTRVVLHTATVLRQEIVDSRATVARNRRLSGIRFAEITIELVPEDVGDQETRR